MSGKWAEIGLRIFMAALAAFLESQGYSSGAAVALTGAAMGDLPFRATSTGASEGRKTEAQAVVSEEVKTSAQK